MRNAFLSLAVPMMALMVVGCSRQSSPQVYGYDAQTREVNKLLIDAYADQPQVRVQAIQRLGAMGIDERPVREALDDGLRHENVQVRRASAEALADLQSVDAMRILRGGANDGHHEARVVYTQEIGDLRQRAQRGEVGASSALRELGEAEYQAERRWPWQRN